jgi:hypothetical protein
MRATWIVNASRAADAHYARLQDWHPYFAFLPKWVADGDCRWLEWIERKIEYVGAYDGTYGFASYRAAPTPTSKEE